MCQPAAATLRDNKENVLPSAKTLFLIIGGGALTAAQWHGLPIIEATLIPGRPPPPDGPDTSSPQAYIESLLVALLVHGILVFVSAAAQNFRLTHKQTPAAGTPANHRFNQQPSPLPTDFFCDDDIDTNSFCDDDFDTDFFCDDDIVCDDDIDSTKNAASIRSWATRQSLAINKIMELDETAAKRQTWLSSFVGSDPRQQILNFFGDVAQQGAKDLHENGVSGEVASILLKAFPKASVFSVWRPTSRDAIRKMMTGEGTGKGLDIKGKSSKHGIFSGNVPFLQIHQEEDKHRIRGLERDTTLRIFYTQDCQREEAIKGLKGIAGEMHKAIVEAKTLLSDELSDEDARKQANLTLNKWDMEPISTPAADKSADKLYIRRIEDPRAGIEIPERLFWEAFVIRQDISRPSGSKYDSGRPSLPAFQDMNFATMRKPSKLGQSRPVIYQLGPPLCPRSLVIAYEENNQVLPVVSDFDCFVVGTRNVQYSEPLPKDQIDVLTWMIDNIEEILNADAVSDDSWTSRWLEVLKKSTLRGFYPNIPPFGFGDPMSYLIMEHAIGRLKNTGAVRHGAECFNYYFPQELDDEFLVISDRLPGNVPWRYVNQTELQSILVQFIHEGFTFPINPKWILCDVGWKSIFGKLLESDHSTVKDSMNIWYPPEVRERIQKISRCFPMGFEMVDSAEQKASADVDMAEFELEHFITMNTTTLFEKIGGEDAIKAAVDEFYCRVIADPELSPFFEGIDAVPLKAHQRRFFKMAFTRIPAGIDMTEVLIKKHARLFDDGLNERHFDKVFGHLGGALKHVGVPDEMIEEAVAIVGPLRGIFEKGAARSQKTRKVLD